MVITGNRKHPVDRVKAESNAAICERANQVKGNVAMNSRRVRNSRTVLVSAAIAHLLAWAAFLWIALYPHAYQGVSATPLNVSGAGATDTEREREVERYSASYAEINGYGALIPAVRARIGNGSGPVLPGGVEGKTSREYVGTVDIGHHSPAVLRSGLPVLRRIVLTGGRGIDFGCCCL